MATAHQDHRAADGSPNISDTTFSDRQQLTTNVRLSVGNVTLNEALCVLMLSAVLAGDESREAIVAHVLTSLGRTNTFWAKDGKTLTDPAEVEVAVSKAVELFLGERLPLWRRLQIL